MGPHSSAKTLLACRKSSLTLTASLLSKLLCNSENTLGERTACSPLESNRMLFGLMSKCITCGHIATLLCTKLH